MCDKDDSEAAPWDSKSNQLGDYRSILVIDHHSFFICGPSFKKLLAVVNNVLPFMTVNSVKDWEGLNEEIETVQGKKKSQASVAIEIIVPDDNMESLHHTLGKGKNANKKGTGKGCGGHTRKEIKITDLNLMEHHSSWETFQLELIFMIQRPYVISPGMNKKLM
ncbi:hypothetical protein JB92DRAFT_3121739 [Gautieria morchelliformis]|nr:hypothetical protein JB92DRAFT_3121739 [Gautieria morchelliformis]